MSGPVHVRCAGCRKVNPISVIRCDHCHTPTRLSVAKAMADKPVVEDVRWSRVAVAGLVAWLVILAVGLMVWMAV